MNDVAGLIQRLKLRADREATLGLDSANEDRRQIINMALFNEAAAMLKDQAETIVATEAREQNLRELLTEAFRHLSQSVYCGPGSLFVRVGAAIVPRIEP